MENSENKDMLGADFEKKIDALRDIVEKLESDIPLEDGMKLFEKGIGLTKECIAELNKTQESIEKLKGELDLVLGISE